MLGAGGSCRSPGRRCGGCGGSGGWRGWVPRGPFPEGLHALVSAPNVARAHNQGPEHGVGVLLGLQLCTGGAGRCGSVWLGQLWWGSPCHLTAWLGGSGPSSLGVGSWLKALYGSAHQEPWGRGDVALGSARPGAGLNLLLSPRGHRPLPQYLLICYKSCWDGAFQVTEEVTPQCAPMLWGLWRSPTPWDTAEPGDMVCWVALWHQRGCRSPGHGTAGFPSQSRCRGPAGLSCPWTCQSPLSVAAFSSAQHCG